MGSIFTQRRSPDDRQKRYNGIMEKKARELLDRYYAKGGTGTFDLTDSSITKLPSGIKINGDFYAGSSSLKQLPDDIQISGSLYLGYSQIQELPATLNFVNGNLELDCTPIRKLPSPLTVTETLSLTYCEDMHELPRGLKVDQLYVDGLSYLTRLPPDIVVSGTIFISGSGLSGYSDEALKARYPGINNIGR